MRSFHYNNAKGPLAVLRVNLPRKQEILPMAALPNDVLDKAVVVIFRKPEL